MIRYYCDFCNDEITDKNKASGGPIHCSDRLGASMHCNDKVLKVEIITSVDGIANSGLACRHCILDALNQLDIRPKMVAVR